MMPEKVYTRTLLPRMVVALFGVFLLLFLTPQRAAAVEGISLSNDGATWGEALAEPLFDDQILWVPGDTRDAEFFVRNDTAQDAELQIDFLSAEIDELIDLGDLVISTRVDNGEWTSTSTAGLQGLSTSEIAAGGTRAIQVRAALPFSSPNSTQAQALDFDLLVTLSHTAPPTVDPVAPVTPPPPDASGLPMTGGALNTALLSIAAVALSVGAFLTAAARRRRTAAESKAPRGLPT